MKKEYVYNGLLVNVLATVIAVPVIFVMIYGYELMNSIDSFFPTFLESLEGKLVSIKVFYVVSIFLGILIHEFLHGVIFAFYAENGLKDVKFGFNVKACAPYAHCKSAICKNQYIFALVMPGLVLGIIPAIWSLFYSNILIYSWSILFVISALGDFLILIRMIGLDQETLILDHPKKVGFIIASN
ncbi:MAG: DUF3267 domain-containing protein [Marinilabiliaceae bacterium]|nr:DUF3267 domain-containing protein [Marinilabiliaceae bacterium]